MGAFSFTRLVQNINLNASTQQNATDLATVNTDLATVNTDLATVNTDLEAKELRIESALGEGTTPRNTPVELFGCYPLFYGAPDAKRYKEAGDSVYIPVGGQDFQRPVGTAFWKGHHDSVKAPIEVSYAPSSDSLAENEDPSAYPLMSFDNMFSTNDDGDVVQTQVKSLVEIPEMMQEKWDVFEGSCDKGEWVEPGVLGYRVHVTKNNIFYFKYSHPTLRTTEYLVEQNTFNPANGNVFRHKDYENVLVVVQEASGDKGTKTPRFNNGFESLKSAEGSDLMRAKIAEHSPSVDPAQAYNEFLGKLNVLQPDIQFESRGYNANSELFQKGMCYSDQTVFIFVFDESLNEVQVMEQFNYADGFLPADSNLSTDVRGVLDAMLAETPLRFEYEGDAGKYQNKLRMKRFARGSKMSLKKVSRNTIAVAQSKTVSEVDVDRLTYSINASSESKAVCKWRMFKAAANWCTGHAAASSGDYAAYLTQKATDFTNMVSALVPHALTFDGVDLSGVADPPQVAWSLSGEDLFGIKPLEPDYYTDVINKMNDVSSGTNVVFVYAHGELDASGSVKGMPVNADDWETFKSLAMKVREEIYMEFGSDALVYDWYINETEKSFILFEAYSEDVLGSKQLEVLFRYGSIFSTWDTSVAGARLLNLGNDLWDSRGFQGVPYFGRSLTSDDLPSGFVPLSMRSNGRVLSRFHYLSDRSVTIENVASAKDRSFVPTYELNYATSQLDTRTTGTETKSNLALLQELNSVLPLEKKRLMLSKFSACYRIFIQEYEATEENEQAHAIFDAEMVKNGLTECYRVNMRNIVTGDREKSRSALVFGFPNAAEMVRAITFESNNDPSIPGTTAYGYANFPNQADSGGVLRMIFIADDPVAFKAELEVAEFGEMPEGMIWTELFGVPLTTTWWELVGTFGWHGTDFTSFLTFGELGAAIGNSYQLETTITDIQSRYSTTDALNDRVRAMGDITFLVGMNAWAFPELHTDLATVAGATAGVADANGNIWTSEQITQAVNLATYFSKVGPELNVNNVAWDSTITWLAHPTGVGPWDSSYVTIGNSFFKFGTPTEFDAAWFGNEYQTNIKPLRHSAWAQPYVDAGALGAFRAPVFRGEKGRLDYNPLLYGVKVLVMNFTVTDVNLYNTWRNDLPEDMSDNMYILVDTSFRREAKVGEGELFNTSGRVMVLEVTSETEGTTFFANHPPSGATVHVAYVLTDYV